MKFLATLWSKSVCKFFTISVDIPGYQCGISETSTIL